MSRTDKDRPYYVMVADPTLERQAVHRHHLLGKSTRIYRWMPMWGEEEPATISIQVESYDVDFSKLADSDLYWLDVITNPEAHTDYATKNGYEIPDRKSGESVTEDIMFSDHCTIDEAPENSDVRSRPCYYTLTAQSSLGGKSKSEQAVEKGMTKSFRRKASLLTRQYEKELNGSGLAEYDENSLPSTINSAMKYIW